VMQQALTLRNTGRYRGGTLWGLQLGKRAHLASVVTEQFTDAAAVLAYLNRSPHPGAPSPLEQITAGLRTEMARRYARAWLGAIEHVPTGFATASSVGAKEGVTRSWTRSTTAIALLWNVALTVDDDALGFRAALPGVPRTAGCTRASAPLHRS
jgi:hypothetical protein